MEGRIYAPFNEDQVAALNRYQQNIFVHQYTCGSGNRTDETHTDGEGILQATAEGWVCPFCDYKQNWAHAGSTEISDYNPFPELNRKIFKNQTKKPRNQCVICDSLECYTRIYTEDFEFDEVACRVHAKALYQHANRAVDKSLKPIYQTGTTIKQREAAGVS